MKLRHPNIKPDLDIEVADDRVAAHVAAGWLPLAVNTTGEPEAVVTPEDTPERPRRTRRAGSDSQKETAA